MSTKVEVRWNINALHKSVKHADGVREELARAAMPYLDANNAASKSLSRRYTSKGLRSAPYAMEVRELRNFPAAVIHSTNKLAALIGRENGLPHW